MAIAETDRRRSVWLMFYSAAVKGYVPTGDYSNYDDFIDEVSENAAAMADACLREYLIRDEEDFILPDEEEEDPDDDEDEDEDEEEEEEDNAARPRKRHTAKRRKRK